MPDQSEVVYDVVAIPPHGESWRAVTCFTEDDARAIAEHLTRACIYPHDVRPRKINLVEEETNNFSSISQTSGSHRNYATGWSLYSSRPLSNNPIRSNETRN
jgi:hypothetical protein